MSVILLPSNNHVHLVYLSSTVRISLSYHFLKSGKKNFSIFQFFILLTTSFQALPTQIFSHSFDFEGLTFLFISPPKIELESSAISSMSRKMICYKAQNFNQDSNCFPWCIAPDVQGN